MIDFLLGALSVLATRGRKVVDQLEGKADLPPSVISHCSKVASRARLLVDGISRRVHAIHSLKEKIDKGHLSFIQAEPFLRGSFQAYRDFRRELDSIEEFFVGHINRFIEADKLLSSMAAAIWKEAGLPGTAPVAVASTSGYFCTVASLGIVFSPPSAEHHLLILPDFYHESGHLLDGQGVALFGPRFQPALLDHAKGLRNQIRRVSRPLKPETVPDIVSRWAHRWAEEVACDTLAARLVGRSCVRMV